MIHNTGLVPSEIMLSAGSIHVWRASLCREPIHISRLWHLLSPDELSRAARFRYDIDRIRFVIARGQLRILLSYYLGYSPSGLRFRYNAFGKPFLENSQGLEFNVAHSRDMALYALAGGAEIGVDVEYMRTDFATDDIAQHYFSPAENGAFCGLSPEAKCAAFFACWTRKEAYIKARGRGLSIPLDSFDVSFAPGEPPELLNIRNDATQETSDWSLFDLRPAPGYAGALAIKGSGWKLSHWDFTDLLAGLLDTHQRSQ